MTRSRVGSMKLRRRVEIRNSRPKTWKRNASERVVVASCLGRLERTREERMVTRFSRVILCWRSSQQRWTAELHMPARPLAKVLSSDKLRCYVASNCMVEHPKFMEEHFPQHPCSFKATQRAYAYLIFFFALELHQPKSKTYDFIPIDKVLDTKPNFPTLVFWEPWTTTKTTNKMWDDKLRLGKFCIYE